MLRIAPRPLWWPTLDQDNAPLCLPSFLGSLYVDGLLGANLKSNSTRTTEDLLDTPVEVCGRVAGPQSGSDGDVDHDGDVEHDGDAPAVATAAAAVCSSCQCSISIAFASPAASTLAAAAAAITSTPDHY